jgi:hypothetical protein
VSRKVKNFHTRKIVMLIGAVTMTPVRKYARSRPIRLGVS